MQGRPHPRPLRRGERLGYDPLMGALFSYWLLTLGITTYRSAAAGTPAG
ncbi:MULTISPECIES: hypothetical protein [unclassified Streptomyces]|nr:MULTISPECIES: hypothetical protein [unclassified Streptomyces]